jgi:hypothetical protein
MGLISFWGILLLLLMVMIILGAKINAMKKNNGTLLDAYYEDGSRSKE